MPNNLQDYLKSRRSPQDVNLKHTSNLRRHDKIAVRVTAAVGSMYAVYFLSTVILGWMFIQKTLSHPFDPYPFAFLLFITNIIQLLLMPLILVGQNIQSKHSELRADEEYKTTQTIHQDNEKILQAITALSQKLN